MDLVGLCQSRGLDPKRVSGTQGGEFHSGCPECGGKDRFYIQPEKQQKNCVGFFACRQCGIYGDTIQFAKDYGNYSFEEALRNFGVRVASPIMPRSFYLPKYPEPIKAEFPSEKWRIAAQEFIDSDVRKRDISRARFVNNEYYSDAILRKHQIYLNGRGLSNRALSHNDILFNPKSIWVSRSSWGLPEELNAHGKPKMLWIPSGIIIPSKIVNDSPFDIVRIKIRRDDYKDGDDLPKYVAISGSMAGLNVVGFANQPMAIIVESELDAYAIDDILHDKVFSVATGSALKNPDEFTHFLIKDIPLLICHDNDTAGWKMMGKWRSLYPRSISMPVPIGKDIGEAINLGFDVRGWIIEKLKLLNEKE